MTGARFGVSDTVMGTQTDKAEVEPARTDGADRIGLWLTVLVWIMALSLRLWAGRDLPLWIDETWTGMIASQPDWQSFWREAWFDVNPPFYYAVMAGWTKLAGTTDVALRLPSLIFVIAAAALPLFWRSLDLTSGARRCWSCLLILWWPGFEISVDARGYALLLLVSVGQVLAWGDAIAKGTVRTAAVWAGLASAAILTHYFAIVPAALQGLLLAWRHRMQAPRLWPAALFFVPAFGWIGYHAPRLADYARPDVVWYSPVTSASALSIFQYVVGTPGWGYLLLLVALLATASLARRPTLSGPSPTTAARDVALCGVAAFVLLLAVGAARATLTDRYFVPIVPSALLGLVLVMSRYPKAFFGQALLVFAFLTPIASPPDVRAHLQKRTFYGFERASVFAMEHGVSRLTFVWDHPAAKILDERSLAKLGSFFLLRSGQNVPTRAVTLEANVDGNMVLPMSAQGGSVIWIYNRARKTAARSHPPDAARWTGWTCQHERGPWVGILTCVHVAKPTAPVKVTP